MIDEPTRGSDAVAPEPALRGLGRDLVPRVLAGLVRRGEDFDAAEDALQEALLEALRVWPEHPPRDPRAWLTTVATRRLVDARRSEAARNRREVAGAGSPEPQPAATEEGDDTLFLLFCCCHPDLAPASQVALTLRAVGGLSTTSRPQPTRREPVLHGATLAPPCRPRIPATRSQRPPPLLPRSNHFGHAWARTPRRSQSSSCEARRRSCASSRHRIGLVRERSRRS